MRRNVLAPPRAARLSRGEWISVLKRTGKRFLADDCVGLAQEVAYNALLAFFPAIAFLLGLLGLLHLFNSVQSLLGTVAPSGVINFIQGLQNDSRGGTKIAALVVGGAGATWAASGAMGSVIKAVNRAYERGETRPFWKVRGTAILLVVLFGVTLVALAVLIVFGAPLGRAIADKAQLGGAFMWLWAILRWPVAFVAVLLLFALVYYFAPNKDQRDWKWVTHVGRGGIDLARPLRALHRLCDVRGQLLEDVRLARRRGDPAPVAELHRLGAPLRRRAELGARPHVRRTRRRQRARGPDETRPSQSVTQREKLWSDQV
jgi:YihY family inner membrane protein